ncbi:MAG: EVE domain-containing protein [Verrucomicrobiaceae bacterium]|nr:MAG: EVE domain-containing protein [Verrucomicrobiaceae bacterium]
MAIWLLKTEPSNYSYDDLERDIQTMWDGVTNNLALKYLREIPDPTKRKGRCESVEKRSL